MFISLNSTLTGGRAAWPEFARLAASIGYPGVDVNLAKAMEAGVEATNSLLAELRLKPAVVELPVEFRKDDAAFQQGFEKLDAAAKFAAEIGCPRMTTWVMPSSNTRKAELHALYLRRFGACADVLARHKVRLGLEFISPLHLRNLYTYEFIWRMSDMVAFAKEIGPNAGVLLDSWHWHHAGGKVADILDAGRSRVVHVQVNDSQAFPPEKIRDTERLLPGEGVIDLKGFFGALREIAYQDGVSVEVFGRGLKQLPPDEGARLGLEAARAAMFKAGVL